MKQKVHKRVDDAFKTWLERRPGKLDTQLLNAFRAGWKAQKLVARVASEQKKLLGRT